MQPCSAACTAKQRSLQAADVCAQVQQNIDTWITHAAGVSPQEATSNSALDYDQELKLTWSCWTCSAKPEKARKWDRRFISAHSLSASQGSGLGGMSPALMPPVSRNLNSSMFTVFSMLACKSQETDPVSLHKCEDLMKQPRSNVRHGDFALCFKIRF